MALAGGCPHATMRAARPYLASVTLLIESKEVTTPSTMEKPPPVSTVEWRPVACRTMVPVHA